MKVHYVGHKNVLELSEEEYQSIKDIFDSFQTRTIFPTAYAKFTHQWGSIDITDDMLNELERIYHSIKGDHPWKEIIHKIFKLREDKEIIIE